MIDYEVVFSEQKLVKRYRFKRTQLTNDLHEIVCSNQKHQLYSFMRTALTDSDFDDSEGSYIRNSDACMTSWHLLDVDFHKQTCAFVWQNRFQDQALISYLMF